MNNLKALRRARNWTQNEAATKLSTTRNQYAKIENGTRRLTEKWIDRAAAAFDVDHGEIVRGAIARPPIVGRVLADGSIEWTKPKVPFAEYALTIETSALGPLLENALVVFEYDDRARLDYEPNRLCIVAVEGGTPRLGKLTKSALGMHHVVCTHGVLFDQIICWVCPVVRIDF